MSTAPRDARATHTPTLRLLHFVHHQNRRPAVRGLDCPLCPHAYQYAARSRARQLRRAQNAQARLAHKLLCRPCDFLANSCVLQRPALSVVGAVLLLPKIILSASANVPASECGRCLQQDNSYRYWVAFVAEYFSPGAVMRLSVAPGFHSEAAAHAEQDCFGAPPEPPRPSGLVARNGSTVHRKHTCARC